MILHKCYSVFFFSFYLENDILINQLALSRNKKETKSPVTTVKIFSNDILKFGFDKCAILQV